MQEITERIATCVELGKISRTTPFPPHMKDQDGADEIAAEALKNGAHPDALLAGCMQGMERIGKQFSENLVFVPNLLMSAAAMNAVMKHLKPYLESGVISATICQDPYHQGYLPVKILFDYLLDKKLPESELIHTKTDIMIREIL